MLSYRTADWMAEEGRVSEARPLSRTNLRFMVLPCRPTVPACVLFLSHSCARASRSLFPSHSRAFRFLSLSCSRASRFLSSLAPLHPDCFPSLALEKHILLSLLIPCNPRILPFTLPLLTSRLPIISRAAIVRSNSCLRASCTVLLCCGRATRLMPPSGSFINYTISTSSSKCFILPLRALHNRRHPRPVPPVQPQNRDVWSTAICPAIFAIPSVL